MQWRWWCWWLGLLKSFYTRCVTFHLHSWLLVWYLVSTVHLLEPHSLVANLINRFEQFLQISNILKTEAQNQQCSVISSCQAIIQWGLSFPGSVPRLQAVSNHSTSPVSGDKMALKTFYCLKIIVSLNFSPQIKQICSTLTHNLYYHTINFSLLWPNPIWDNSHYHLRSWAAESGKRGDK